MVYKTNEVMIGSVLSEDIYYKSLLIAKKGSILTKNVKKLLIDCNISEIHVEAVCNDSIDSRIKSFTTLDGLLNKYLKVAGTKERMLITKELIVNLIRGELKDEMDTLREYDKGTYRHSKNVAVISLLCGTYCNLTKTDVYYLSVASLLHDYGKLMIPISIIQKNGKLTDDERTIMQTHTVEGKRLLDNTIWKDTIVPSITLKHHENWDGTGYPSKDYGISCNKLARIVHIADVYEALIAKRPYKENKQRYEARDIIEEGSGTMFDPALVKIFLNNIPPYFIGEEVIYKDTFASIVDIQGLDPVLRFVNGTTIKVDGKADLNFKASDLELIK